MALEGGIQISVLTDWGAGRESLSSTVTCRDVLESSTVLVNLLISLPVIFVLNILRSLCRVQTSVELLYFPGGLNLLMSEMPLFVSSKAFCLSLPSLVRV